MWFQLLEKFAEDQRLEQLTAEKRKMKMLEYKTELQKLLEERHKRRLEEMHELIALEEVEKQEENNRQVNMKKKQYINFLDLNFFFPLLIFFLLYIIFYLIIPWFWVIAHHQEKHIKIGGKYYTHKNNRMYIFVV